MDDFLEFDDKKKVIKSINLDDFSVEDLKKYIEELNTEINKAKNEINKKIKIKNEAQKFFK